MRNWFQSWLGHIFLGLIALDHLWDRLKPVCEKCREIGTFIERRIGDRRHIMSLATVINGITLAEKDAPALSAFLVKLPEYAPIIQKQFADLQKAEADRNNPVALMADVSVLLADLTMDMNTIVPFITNLIPALKSGAPIQTPVPPAAS
jgi:hypothetical protein